MRVQDYARAKQIVLGMVRELSLATGENLTGSNELLSEFPDLAEKVAGMQMSEEAALELAKHRRTADRQNRQQQAYAAAAAEPRGLDPGAGSVDAENQPDDRIVEVHRY